MSQIITNKAQLEEALNPYRRKGVSIGFVPTMGALHAGHASLMHAAKRETALLVLSIFVNPRQFNDSLDFETYPRTLSEDIARATTEGVDVIYLPQYDELFLEDSPASKMSLNGLDLSMEGASRPGHFRGVVEVVYALFNHVKPHRAFFGQKDFQQLAIIRAMVNSLSLPVFIVSCPTLREVDGLAMSSRNLRLTSVQRQTASVLYRALSLIQEYWNNEPPLELIHKAKEMIRQSPLTLDYLFIVDPNTLLPVEISQDTAVVCVAAYCGEVRLIDNMLLSAD
jgi:pantoate--beta-alanine ligase